MKMIRQQTAYYGVNRYGQPTAILYTEWRSGSRSGRILERNIDCDSIEQARAMAYGMSRNARPLPN
ncbi:hypothetical protein [Burkholderia vietnamiensis]|uniref:hypothetical protein n=1 Tax=Burkholderia vietnamiensis TaxID=60552 RepID=UPI001594C381|nr:hypothetical protein [Burkholderia vietnamiensis]MCA8270380.1 hypothetical protein [Burkholderia vietnamiensis]